MSEAHKDGGRAFPCDQIIERDADGHLHGREVASGGMTLRDYFAAQFMTRAQSLCEMNDGWEMHNAAQCAYAMADAMLQARKP